VQLLVTAALLPARRGAVARTGGTAYVPGVTHRSRHLELLPACFRAQGSAWAGVALTVAVGVAGCSASSANGANPGGSPRGTGGAGLTPGSGSAPLLGAGGGTLLVPDPVPGSGGADSKTGIEAWPSPACASAAVDAVSGQYCPGPAYVSGSTGGSIQSASGCGTTLWGIARDFIGYNQVATQPAGMPHPDFGSHYCCGNPQGTVLSTLGADDKPVYNPANVAGDYSSGVGLSGPEAFNQWFNDVPSVNLAYLVAFHLVPAADGLTQVFASKLYFPVDDRGFGNFNDYGEDGKSHNFGFTTELHTKFKYQGGEVFSFEGDDDLWVFVDKKLAIDLGGIHSASPGEVKLDEFARTAGLVVGQTYSLDLFGAERHPSGSNFKITTSMTFVDCGVNPVIR